MPVKFDQYRYLQEAIPTSENPEVLQSAPDQIRVNVHDKIGETVMLTPEQKQILEKLRKVKGSEARVKTMATILDKYGVEAIASLIPALGDVGVSAVVGTYLLAEAYRAGLSWKAVGKIAALQAADSLVGLIPGAGDLADFFFRATSWSYPEFAKKVDQVAAEARQAGIPEDQIQLILSKRQKAAQLAQNAIHKVPAAK